MSLPWRPELQQVRTRSGCETLQRRLRVKWRQKSEYAFRTPLWVLDSGKGKTALFQEGFAISGKEFRSPQSVGGLGWRGGLRSRVSLFEPRLTCCEVDFGSMNLCLQKLCQRSMTLWLTRHPDSGACRSFG
jgi:hypothetical protein